MITKRLKNRKKGGTRKRRTRGKRAGNEARNRGRSRGKSRGKSRGRGRSRGKGRGRSKRAKSFGKCCGFHPIKRKKCIVKNKAVRYDPGYRDKWRGWYDVQGCGKCHDYCRWVGDSGPGGDPSKSTTRKIRGKKKSIWSCWLADASEGHKTYSSNKKWPKKFKFTRCSKEGIPQWDFKKENWIF